MVAIIKHWLTSFFEKKDKSIDVQYQILLHEVKNTSSLKQLTITRNKLEKFNLEVKKLNSPPYAVAYVNRLKTTWNHRYKLIQLELRG